MRLIDSTQQTLVAALQQGKPEALGLLYDKYAPVLLGLITRMVTDPEVSETVLQKTFAAIWLKKHEYNATRLSFLSWIITIARDKAKVAMLSLKTKGFSFTTENSTFTQEVNAIYEEPREQQLQEFCCRLEENEKKARIADLNHIKIPISILKWLKLRLGDVFGFLIAHNERHLQQAKRNLVQITHPVILEESNP